MGAPKEIRAELDIDASAQRVWEVLTDFEAFPEWNPFLLRASGPLREGERIEVVLRPPGRKPSTFRPTLRTVDPARELRWIGHVGFRGVFDGEHVFRIEPREPERVRFIQEEFFRGFLRPLLGNLLRATEEGFTAMNAALKARAEAAVPPSDDRS
ncbi:MAG: SRPBCC domain-containing protein [Thermoplasmata archaeon]|nr:SRPBCC domain-containing protein [Thermoplasmata archaeon]